MRALFIKMIEKKPISEVKKPKRFVVKKAEKPKKKFKFKVTGGLTEKQKNNLPPSLQKAILKKKKKIKFKVMPKEKAEDKKRVARADKRGNLALARRRKKKMQEKKYS